jgi:PKD repeat protein
MGYNSSEVACAISPVGGDDSNHIHEGQVLSFDDFETYGEGDNPAGWKNTEKENSFTENPSLFTTRIVGNTIAFGTESDDTNIHSHYNGNDSLLWTNYIYTGRMYLTDDDGGIGVTFFSRYPSENDVYYRLRRYAQEPAFRISPHGTSIKGGVDSGIIPLDHTWYRFHIEVEDTGTQTNIRAKVWKEGDAEPENFQIMAYDDSVTRITSGTVGVWTMSSGVKLFDDLAVESNVSPMNNPPIASYVMDPQQSAIAGETVFFDAGESYDPDNNPLSYEWDFGDGSAGIGLKTSHEFTDPGTYDITLTVSDSILSDSVTYPLVVDFPSNSAPVAVISVDPAISALTGETLFFDAGESYDPDGHPLDYTWDFGDGSFGTGVEVSHIFSEPGLYQVLLAVYDGQLTDTEIVGVVIDEETKSLLLSESFEGYATGQDPQDWKDTAKNNGFNEAQSLFKTGKVGDTITFSTSSRETNIHSHYDGDGAMAWTNYIYTGKMYITDNNGGIGITFFSLFPEGRNVYYRLRRYVQEPDFELSPHGTSVKGDTDSGVRPRANSWYRFRIEVEDTGTQTNIRAKVWKDGDEEPEEFQINAYDDSGTRISSGTIGVWSMGKGSKHFDDLEIRPRL